MIRTSAVLLAAGSGSRMTNGRDKLLLPYEGRTLLERAVTLLADVPFHQRILVTTTARLGAIQLPPGFIAVLNDRPEDGQSASLRLGLERAEGDCVMFFTADQPLLDKAAVERLLAAADGRRIVCPIAGGTPRSPVIFPERYRRELMALRGDTGGRAVRDAHPEDCCEVEFGDSGLFRDIDTPEQYRKLTCGFL